MPSKDTIRIFVMDGGMASHLETLGFQMPSGEDSSTFQPHLWSSAALLSDQHLVEQVHRDYIDAGANVLSTCTYQLSLQAVATRDEAYSIMNNAIDILDAAITNKSTGCLRLLSLGPCAIVHPSGAEYSGVYDEPYSSLTRTFVEAQKKWHLKRLELVDTSRLEKVDGFLFETVPLISEIYSIRAAVSQFQNTTSDTPKDVFISMVFPSGRLPGWDLESSAEKRTSESTEDDILDLMRAALSTEQDRASVVGIGINCTNPQYLKQLVQSFTSVLDVNRELLYGRKLALLLYPDGGPTWMNGKFQGITKIEVWLRHIMDALMVAHEDGQDIWDRIMVGGCCNTGPEHIRALYNSLIEHALIEVT